MTYLHVSKEHRLLATKMLKKGDEISIVPSVQLFEMRLGALVNYKAKVCEVNYSSDGSIKGCWVDLIGVPFHGEQQWYIPYSSIV